MKNKITYNEWYDITLKLFKDKRLSRSHFYQIAKNVRLTKNCKEILKLLRDNHVKTVIISGGIDTLLQEVFPDYYNYFWALGRFW